MLLLLFNTKMGDVHIMNYIFTTYQHHARHGINVQNLDVPGTRHNVCAMNDFKHFLDVQELCFL